MVYHIVVCISDEEEVFFVVKNAAFLEITIRLFGETSHLSGRHDADSEANIYVQSQIDKYFIKQKMHK
jgi:hypothetical protein